MPPTESPAMAPPIIDADGHIVEPEATWADYLDPKYLDFVPRPVQDGEELFFRCGEIESFRMKAKAERSAFEADAAKEMAETYGGGDSLEKEFESMGEVSADAEVQKKLAALKEKLGKG